MSGKHKPSMESRWAKANQTINAAPTDDRFNRDLRADPAYKAGMSRGIYSY